MIIILLLLLLLLLNSSKYIFDHMRLKTTKLIHNIIFHNLNPIFTVTDYSNIAKQ